MSRVPVARCGEASFVVWRFTDGRAGHENQTRGLLDALRTLVRLDSHDLRVERSRPGAWLGWLLARAPRWTHLPDPDLLLGAGHDTHVPLLAAARARGGRRVIVMRPSLPVWCFDLCLVPEHDGLSEGPHVMLTRGALNAVRSRPDKDPALALVLLGGPSAHCRWAEPAMLDQVLAVVTGAPSLNWTVAGSPRTPVSTLTALERSLPGSVSIVRFEQSTPGWLASRVAVAGRVWVSEDSVSMVYEALTAGAATGLLELPLARGSRVQRGVARLVEDALVVPFGRWRDGTPLAPPAHPLAEATRCAEEIARRWLNVA